MSSRVQIAEDGGPIDTVRAYIEANLDRPLPLVELGRLVQLSPFTVQRLFKQSLGVSPLQYQRALRAASLRSALKQGESVTHAIYNAGFGSSSRGYDGAQLGMTPARFAAGGRGEQIGFCSARSPFGWIIVGATERGLCWLSLAGTKTEAEAALREEFPAATLRNDPSLNAMVEAALESVVGQTNSSNKLAAPQLKPTQATKPMRADSERLAVPQVLDIRGTAFQLRVWQALRQIPRGETRSYSQLAQEMGMPKSTRAVARACAMNRVALVVPCHRVVGASGSLTGYRWGVERKRLLLEAEGTCGAASGSLSARMEFEQSQV
jgi:AraC family transcriptional regulator of adaptative response/methylated-DNA-[protein]-cysteine methyltransferase